MSPMSLALAGRFFTNRCHLGSLILIPYSNFPKSFQSYLFKFNFLAAAAAAKSLQSCPTLCDPIDSSPPGSPVPEILQARTPEWVAISFSSAWKCKVKVKSLSHVRLLTTPWTAAHQAPPSMGFSRQEYWSGVPLPSPLCYLNRMQRKNRVKNVNRALRDWNKWFSIHATGVPVKGKKQNLLRSNE